MNAQKGDKMKRALLTLALVLVVAAPVSAQTPPPTANPCGTSMEVIPCEPTPTPTPTVSPTVSPLAPTPVVAPEGESEAAPSTVEPSPETVPATGVQEAAEAEAVEEALPQELARTGWSLETWAVIILGLWIVAIALYLLAHRKGVNHRETTP